MRSNPEGLQQFLHLFLQPCLSRSTAIKFLMVLYLEILQLKMHTLVVFVCSSQVSTKFLDDSITGVKVIRHCALSKVQGICKIALELANHFC